MCELVNASHDREQMWKALPRRSRLRTLMRSLPWVYSAQLVELWIGGQHTHVAVARVSQQGCDADILAQLAGIRNVFGSALDAVLNGRMGVAIDGGTNYDDQNSGTGAVHGRPRDESFAEGGINASATATDLAVHSVSEQYEALPFPPRRAADERTRTRPIHSSLASLAEIAHFSFGGRFRRRFCGPELPPFRVLIAGGGTGDATVQIAQELSDLHSDQPGCAYNRSEIVHLDLSAASVRLTSARLHERGLLRGDSAGVRAADRDSGPSVRLIAASLLSLPKLRLGGAKFDYINLCGVLHHLPDPPAALTMLRRHALAPGGAIGLMVYGLLGRRGVYETQAMLRLLHASGNTSGVTGMPRVDVMAGMEHDEGARAAEAPEIRERSASVLSFAPAWPIGARVADAVELLASLPDAATLRRNTPVWRSDEVQLRMGDAGVFDLLLHSTDRPYTRRELVATVRSAGLRVNGWLQAGLYEPRYWLRPCSGTFGPAARRIRTPPRSRRYEAGLRRSTGRRRQNSRSS